jgi:SAM-dependent methyltransferase
MPFLLCAARVAPGMRVLDIATGTGLSAEAALATVGPSGHVRAADLSPAMVKNARERLGKAANVLVSVEDAQALFSDAGFAEITTDTVEHNFVLPSFDAYYGSFERGGASTGQALAAVSEEIRRAVREEVRRELADTGGPIEVEVEYRIANGRR